MNLTISTPGRICLFGEHQDYLGLPVIAGAISLRVFIEGSRSPNKIINISLPDIDSTETFSLNGRLEYNAERDYFKSAVNVLLSEGFTFSSGIDCKVYGEIPINAGTSSSSALIVSWINMLARLSDQEAILEPEKIAELAYRAEVEEFSEPGGKMDHYSTALGGIIGLETYPEPKITRISRDLGTFVLGNSREPKDTTTILSRVKNEIIGVVEYLRKMYMDFSLQDVTLDEVEIYKHHLKDYQFRLLKGTITNRDITRKAFELLKSDEFDSAVFGELMNQHQAILRDVLKISTPKIDNMIDAALEAGALCGKINGSGGGGCMFAYAPENPEKVFHAVKKISGEAYMIRTGNGTLQEQVWEEVK